MIHDYPDRAEQIAFEELPELAVRPEKSNLPLILVLLISLSIAFAAIVTNVDFERLQSYWPFQSGVKTAAINKTVQQELVAATMADQTVVAADGAAAEQLNADLPFSELPVEAARPFALDLANMSGAERALMCLTQAVYYEAGFEPLEGRRAVAQVILNRMRHPAFPKSVCGVIYQGSNRAGCQFSFACDGSLLRAPNAASWAVARQVASEALSGSVASTVGTATHYHANYVSPYWAPKLTKITQLGAHIFYRWPGNWGLKGAFSGAYSGNEFIPAVSSLANMNAVKAQPGAELEIGAIDMAVVAPRDVTDRRTENDTGGRIDTTKTWRLSIPMPNETRGAFENLSNKQDVSAPQTVGATK
jgi:spore germination cell wall hydrolase CwlJ-like protein